MSSSFDKKFNFLKIPLKEIKEATNSFDDENLIKHSGSLRIYKGQLLRSGKSIDIVARRFDPKSWRTRKEFMKEITMLSALKHPNLASIVGFCDENNEMIIITKFEVNGSLDQHLSDPTLTWTQRLQICNGIAEALSYIHYDKTRKFSVIHGNVKSSKILLDDKWEPKLFGFELSKTQAVARRQGLVLDQLNGTGAYVDPAYVKSGGVTHKSDVYSLGVVLFEVLCGRPAFVKHTVSTMTGPISKSQIKIRSPDFEDQPGKHEELVTTDTLSSDMIEARSLDQMGPLDLEDQPGKHEELVTTDTLSSDMIEARSLDQMGPLDLEDQPGKHEELVTMDNLSSDMIEERSLDHMGSLDLEDQPGKHEDLATMDPLSSAMIEARSLDQIGPDLEDQPGKHEDLATMDPLSSDVIEARSLDQMRSFDLEDQPGKHEELVTMDTLSSAMIEAQLLDQTGSMDIEYQTGKHDENAQPRLLIQMELPDFEYQARKQDEHVQPQSFVDLEYQAKIYDEHATMGTLIETRSIDQMCSLDLKYQVEKHDELVTMDPASRTLIEARSHDRMKTLDLEYQSGKHEELVTVDPLSSTIIEAPPVDVMGSLGKHDELVQPPSLTSLNLEYQAGKYDENVQPPSLTSLNLEYQAGKYDENAPSISMVKRWSFDYHDELLKMAPSLSDMVPPTYSDIINQNMSSWNNLSTVADYPRESHISEEDYMITRRSLHYLNIPEDGLLAKLAKSHYENKTLDDIIQSNLRKQMDSQSLKKFSEAAYCCLNEQRAQRPNIDRVILALKQALELQLQHENSEHSTVAVKGTPTDQLKGKDFEHLKIGYDAIKLATENFAQKYYIGQGGYGIVYKAELEHYDSSMLKDNEESELPKKRSMVAIKYIIKREGTEGEKGFIAEIATLGSCKHRNIVSLLGFCHEHPHMILVYELVSNGSLADYLGNEGKMTNLTWVQRIKICLDIAHGLDYVHTNMDKKGKIIHGDIKSANILLGENLEAKIADFGLSRIQPLNHTKSTIITNTLLGTKMYWDPEYEISGHLKKESDVYSFGVVLFELLTGRLAYDPVYTNENEKGLAPIARQKFEEGTLTEMVDPKLKEESDGYGFSLSKGPNKDSLRILSKIGYQCLSEKQDQRPRMIVVIKELEKSLKLQETHKDGLRISIDDIQRATQGFDNANIIGRGGYGKVYRGEILRDKEPIPIVAKRNDKSFGQGEKEFLTELEILFEYKHGNIISLVGYCQEINERISVFEYASNGSLDLHLNNTCLTWTNRLNIGINIAIGLEFLHGGGSTQAAVIHRDIKSSNILLTGDWKAKISDFGLSIITAIDDEMDFEVGDACGTLGYIDPLYREQGFFTRESDIYSLGVVLFEIMCGRLAMVNDYHNERRFLVDFVKRHYEEGKLDELVFEDIKNMIVPKSLTAYQSIAYECLHDEREKRPTANKVVSKLKEALRFQEDIEIWEAKRPRDYKEIIQMSKTPEKYSNMSNKDLYETFSNGILLQNGKVFFSLGSNGERDVMVSATMFSYENNILHNKRISIQNSRFQRVVKMMDISNLKTRIKIKTQFLTPNVIYGAHIVFKFCDPRKFSSKLMYVNLKYNMKGKNLHAYFATRGNEEWMMLELCRFIPHKKDVDFEVLLESLSQYYCGSGAIYVEGIHFRAIDDATLKGVERVLKSTSESVQQVSVDYDEITELEDGEELFSLSKADGKKCHMLPAKMVLFDTSDVNCFNWKSLVESRFDQEAVELLSHQVLRIKCKTEAHKLSADTNYACYLVFKLSEQCHGLHCPVRVRDVLLRKNKGFKFLYFRSPRLVNLHGIERVPKQREDGLMEVIVWEFNLGKNDHVPMSLKLRCYEGTMSGLIVYGIEFRSI